MFLWLFERNEYIFMLLYDKDLLSPDDYLSEITEDIVRVVNEQVKKVMKTNRITVRKNFNLKGKTIDRTYTFTTPSIDNEKDTHLNYRGKQWFWDSCFHAMILSDFDMSVAMEELFSLFTFQREDGFIPHMIYWEGDGQVPPLWAKEAGIEYFWSNAYCSDIIQPPIIAIAAEKIYNVTKDGDFLKTILGNLKNYYDYLYIKRDPDKDNLISILHPWESGWDNSQRWDELLGVRRDNGHVKRSDIDKKKIALFVNNASRGWNEESIFSSGNFDVEPVDFNVLYSLNMKSLERLFLISEDIEQADIFAKRAEDTRKAILEHMWDGDKYVDLLGKDNIKSSVKAASMFYPMMLEEESHYEYLIGKHLLNRNEFASPYGIPVTSMDDPTYDPEQYWRGNVWINVNNFVVHGLKKIYGDHNMHSAKVAWNYIRNSSYLLLKNFYEYFNPQTGEGYGVKSLAWNGVVNEM
jgi:glycogen debranching enzyme